MKILKTAMCHSSYANEHRQRQIHDNERLEFLGDAVLEVSSSEFLFRHYPDIPEGKLTKLRASIVCEPTLALCAREIHLEQYLLLGKGEEHTGGRYRDSIISDAMEALIGAIYLDGGFANAKEFVEKFILTDIEHKKLFYDSKTILQERYRKTGRTKRSYVLIGEEGPDHARRFVVELCADRREESRGQEKAVPKRQRSRRRLTALSALERESGNLCI